MKTTIIFFFLWLLIIFLGLYRIAEWKQRENQKDYNLS